MRNLGTQETYVGQSKDLNYRYKEHIYHNQYKVDKDIRNYGKECFDFIVLELCDHDELDEKEEYYINALESDKYAFKLFLSLTICQLSLLSPSSGLYDKLFGI